MIHGYNYSTEAWTKFSEIAQMMESKLPGTVDVNQVEDGVVFVYTESMAPNNIFKHSIPGEKALALLGVCDTPLALEVAAEEILKRFRGAGKLNEKLLSMLNNL